MMSAEECFMEKHLFLYSWFFCLFYFTHIAQTARENQVESCIQVIISTQNKAPVQTTRNAPSSSENEENA